MKILIISDIHANLRALQAVLNTHGDADEVWCLGDLVEYGPCPSECVDLVRQHCRHVVQGNHDASYVSAAAAPQNNVWARDSKADDVAWLDALPTSLRVDSDGRSNYLVHATPQDPLRGVLWPDAEPSLLQEALDLAAADRLFCGHTHMAFIHQQDGRFLTNAGTIGQPRDGDYRAQCVLLEDGEIRFERVDYDLEALRLDYQRANLPEDIKETWFRYTKQGIVDVHGLQLGPFSER